MIVNSPTKNNGDFPMTKIPCSARHRQTALSTVVALAVPLLLIPVIGRLLQAYAAVGRLHSGESLDLRVMVVGFFVVLLMPFVSVVAQYPLYVEYSATHIRARYLHSTIVVETSRVAWVGVNRTGKSFIVLGPGRIIQWIPDSPVGYALSQKYAKSIMENCHTPSYIPQPLTANMKRIVEVMDFVLDPLRCISSIVLASVMCFLFAGVITRWTARGLLTVMPPVTAIGFLVTLFGLVIVPALVPSVVAQLGGQWDHLSLLLKWSRFASPNHNLDRIILQSMVQNLDEISVGTKALNSINATLRSGFARPIVNDLIPIIAGIGNRSTLRELLKLQAGRKMIGNDELLGYDELQTCINQLQARLNV